MKRINVVSRLPIHSITFNASARRTESPTLSTWATEESLTASVTDGCVVNIRYSYAVLTRGLLDVPSKDVGESIMAPHPSRYQPSAPKTQFRS